MDPLHEAYNRELAFIASCTDSARISQRMAVYRQDLSRALDNGWSGHEVYAEALLDAGARRIAELAEVAKAKERDEELRHRAPVYEPPRQRPMPPLVRPALPGVPAPVPHGTRPPAFPGRALPTGFTAAPLRFVPPTRRPFVGFVEDEPPDEPPNFPPRRAQEAVKVVNAAKSRPTMGAPAGGVPSRERELTGRHLAEFRAARKLSFREAAALLGALPGTLFKAEAHPDRALADKLQVALKGALKG